MGTRCGGSNVYFQYIFEQKYEKSKKKSIENCHFYSREISLYISWACFRYGIMRPVSGIIGRVDAVAIVPIYSRFANLIEYGATVAIYSYSFSRIALLVYHGIPYTFLNG